MAITLSDYSYDINRMNIAERFIMTEIVEDRDALVAEALKIKELCKKEFSNGVFVP